MITKTIHVVAIVVVDFTQSCTPPPIALCWGAHYGKHNRNSALGFQAVLAKNHITLYSCPVLIIDA